MILRSKNTNYETIVKHKEYTRNLVVIAKLTEIVFLLGYNSEMEMNQSQLGVCSLGSGPWVPFKTRPRRKVWTAGEVK